MYATSCLVHDFADASQPWHKRLSVPKVVPEKPASPAPTGTFKSRHDPEAIKALHEGWKKWDENREKAIKADAELHAVTMAANIAATSKMIDLHSRQHIRRILEREVREAFEHSWRATHDTDPTSSLPSPLLCEDVTQFKHVMIKLFLLPENVNNQSNKQHATNQKAQPPNSTAAPPPDSPTKRKKQLCERLPSRMWNFLVRKSANKTVSQRQVIRFMESRLLRCVFPTSGPTNSTDTTTTPPNNVKASNTLTTPTTTTTPPVDVAAAATTTPTTTKISSEGEGGGKGIGLSAVDIQWMQANRMRRVVAKKAKVKPDANAGQRRVRRRGKRRPMEKILERVGTMQEWEVRTPHCTRDDRTTMCMICVKHANISRFP